MAPNSVQEVTLAADREQENLSLPDLAACVQDVDVDGAESIKIADDHVPVSIGNNNVLVYVGVFRIHEELSVDNWDLILAHGVDDCGEDALVSAAHENGVIVGCGSHNRLINNYEHRYFRKRGFKTHSQNDRAAKYPASADDLDSEYAGHPFGSLERDQES